MTFHLALDESVVRDVDGRESIVPLNPPAQLETLMERLEAVPLPPEGSALPVAYLDGQPLSPQPRRLVTEKIRVRLGAAQAAAVAAVHGLRLVALPDYAPGWAILAAACPLEALAASLPTADVMLAKEHATRALPNDPLLSQQWHLSNSNSACTHVNVELGWNYGGTSQRGAGIRTGIVDDGLQTAHPDLTVNVDTVSEVGMDGPESRIPIVSVNRVNPEVFRLGQGVALGASPIRPARVRIVTDHARGALMRPDRRAVRTGEHRVKGVRGVALGTQALARIS